MNNRPLLSIAMAARNAQTHIGRALASAERWLGVRGLSYEVLIADGASSDRTCEIASSFANVRIVSTSDQGLYDGMNSAISAARGEAVIILNADDELSAGMPDAVQHLCTAPDCAAVTGPVIVGRTPEAAKLLAPAGPMTPESLLFGVPALNGRVFRREAIVALGPLRTDIGLGADREFLIRLSAVTPRECARAITPIYFYRVHDASHTIADNAPARHRIYHSDLQLAAHLASADLQGMSRRDVADFETLARLKMLRLKGKDRAGAAPSSHAKVLRGARFLLRGLKAWSRWRGSHSGW